MASGQEQQKVFRVCLAREKVEFHQGGKYLDLLNHREHICTHGFIFMPHCIS